MVYISLWTKPKLLPVVQPQTKNGLYIFQLLGKNKKKIHLALPGVAQWIESMGLQTEMSLDRFPVGAHSWITGQVLSWGRARNNQSMFLLHINVSLPLAPFPSL